MTSKSNGLVQRVLASLTMTATVMSISGLAAFAPIAAHAATPADYGLTEGDVITATGDIDLYIVNQLGYKRLFVNPAIFNLYGHLGWNKVKTVSPAARDAFPTSGLFRNCESGNPKVYGLDVISEDVANLRWVNTTGAQAVIDDPAFFNKVFCINNAEQALYGVGADYTSVLQVPNYSRGPSNTPAPSGPISASLSSDNPASGTLVSGTTAATSQAAADLAHFTFSGNGTVTNLAFKRLGVSADATLTNVYLYQGAKRLTDSATVSNGMITFNDAAGLFAVNGSANISVRSDIAANSAGQTVGVQLTSYTASGNAAVASTLTGNLHSLASADLATVTFSATTTPSTNSALDPADDTVIFQNTATVGTRFIWLKSIQFRVIGSLNVGDLQNFRLYVDGIQQGSSVAQTDSNGYVVFDVTGAPVKLETGGRIIKVLANVVGGSSRNFTVSIRQASDVAATDSQYNAGVLSTVSASTFPLSAGQQTVTEGTLTITKKSDSPSGDIVKDASGAVLARYEFKANGEKLKVENLRVTFTASSGSVGKLRNGAIFAGGVQVGSTKDINEDSQSTPYTEFSLGSSLVITPGSPVIVEIKADIYDADGTNDIAAAQTLAASVAAGSNNVQKLTSLNYMSNSAVAGNTLTVKTGSFTAAKYTGYANQSVVTPKTQFKLGHFTLTAASSENINVNTINVGFDEPTGLPASKTFDVFLKVWSDTGTLVYTSPVKSTVSGTASSSYSVNFTIPVNKTYQVEVYGNLNTMGSGRILQLDFDASGVTGNSSTSTSTAVVSGQTVTTAAGVLTTANSGSIPASRLANGGQTVTAYGFTMQPQYDDFTLQEVYVDLSSAVASSTGAVASLTLKDGATTVGTAFVNTTTGSASFTGLNYPISQTGGTKTLTVDVTLAGVGVGGNVTGGIVKVRLDGMKYQDSNGNVTTTNGLSTSTYTGNSIVDHKAYPTFTAIGLPSTHISVGTNTISKMQISAVGGEIAFKKIKYTVTATGTTLSNFKLFEDGADITSLASASADGKTWEFTNERSISTSKTYELKADSSTAATTDSVSASIANPAGSTPAAPGAYSLYDVTTATFIWSDKSAASHDSTTKDWMGDSLVKDLAVSQSVSGN